MLLFTHSGNFASRKIPTKVCFLAYCKKQYFSNNLLMVTDTFFSLRLRGVFIRFFRLFFYSFSVDASEIFSAINTFTTFFTFICQQCWEKQKQEKGRWRRKSIETRDERCEREIKDKRRSSFVVRLSSPFPMEGLSISPSSANRI